MPHESRDGTGLGGGIRKKPVPGRELMQLKIERSFNSTATAQS